MYTRMLWIKSTYLGHILKHQHVFISKLSGREMRSRWQLTRDVWRTNSCFKRIKQRDDRLIDQVSLLTCKCEDFLVSMCLLLCSIVLLSSRPKPVSESPLVFLFHFLPLRVHKKIVWANIRFPLYLKTYS